MKPFIKDSLYPPPMATTAGAVSERSQKQPRLLIVGIDSSTFRVIGPLVEAGELPTIGRMMAEGVHGILLSSIPSVTPPGWVTSFTGVNPGKHNVFDFKDHTRYLEGMSGYDLGSTTSESVRADTFWRLLNREGHSVGLVNVPMAYPVEPLDGYMIAGFPCPTEGEGLFYPPELEAEVRAEVPDYRFYGDPDLLTREQPGKYVEGINRISTDRVRTTVHLIRSRPTDVAGIIFTEVDRIQHYFWGNWDEAYDDPNPESARFSRVIPDHYRIIDQGLAGMLEAAGPDARVLIYSDHGAGPITRHLYANTYLIQEGFVVMKGDRGAPGKGEGGRRVKVSRFDKRRIEAWLKRRGLERVIHWIPKRLRQSFPVASFETVDWSRTKAFFSSGSAQSFTVNLRGREPHGCVAPGEEYERVVADLMEALQRLRDPATGKSPFASIQRREDIWEGPSVMNGPDVLIEPAEGYVTLKDIKAQAFDDVGPDWRDRTADHERDGIVILWGPGIRKGESLADHMIRDIAPTVLHMFGVAVPRYMDGQVMEDAFDEGWLAQHPVRLTGDEEFVGRDTAGPTMTADEEEVLKERLRGLGYMG